MMTLEQIKQALSDRNLREVSIRTGVGYGNLCAIVRGDRQNPSYAVIKSLSEYLSGVSAA